jgi:hypothetical protein
MLRISPCLDNQLTDDGKAVSPTHRPRSTQQKYNFSLWYSFLLEFEWTTGSNAAGRIRWIEKFIHLIRSQTRNVPACSIMPQPLRYRVPHSAYNFRYTSQFLQGHSGNYLHQRMRWDSSVGIATDYVLDYRGLWVRVPVLSRIFSSLCSPDRLLGPPSLLSNGYWVEAAGEWSWPHTSN